ncbi:MAG: PQQ-dependent sugar dehydrogenase [Novosphingobium sp.]|nr:PQQ-dependent sugar dehydrogenase [Novosphingobium sp.]
MGSVIKHLRRQTLSLALLAFPGMLAAQDLPSPPLPNGPLILQTVAGQLEIQILARGMPHPWSLAFLPGGDMLITERGGQLRRLRPGSNRPDTIAGVPQVHVEGLLGLMEVLPHPQFAANRTLYLTYHKKISDTPKAVAIVLARATLNGNRLTGVKELLVTDTWDGGGGAGGRLVFGDDGKLYMGVGSSRDGAAQEPGSLRGKVLRLNEDGTAPRDNPFVGKAGFRPEIYTWGHRNPSGLAVHPVTRQLWLAEYGPNGGDELNILGAGKNYGWPLVGLGRSYEGPYTSAVTHREGMERAVADFIPGISPSGLAFYTGKDFPSWTSSAFVGAQRLGMIAPSGRLVRIKFDDQLNERSREELLVDVRQRIRDVRMGPDGLMYLLTDEEDGALLVLKPLRPADPDAGGEDAYDAAQGNPRIVR